MTEQAMQQATREAVKGKFGRKQYLVSKVIPKYPQSAEREYVRVANAYMKLLNDTVADYIPRIRDVLMQSGLVTDAADDKGVNQSQNPVIESAVAVGVVGTVVGTAIDNIFSDILKDFTTRQGLFGLSSQIEKMSNLNRKLTIAEWKRVVKRTLGIDIMQDYYNGVKFQQLFDKWVVDNVGLIKTIPQETLGKMREIIHVGYRAGASNKTIAKQIQDAYDVSKSRAQFIARDQTAKLNAQVTQEQQTDAGVTDYIYNAEIILACEAGIGELTAISDYTKQIMQSSNDDMKALFTDNRRDEIPHIQNMTLAITAMVNGESPKVAQEVG